MRYLLTLLLVLLICADRAHAQRSGAGLFLGPTICSDVTGQIAQQTFCLDYSSGALYVWNGFQFVPISGTLAASINTANGITVTNTNGGNNAQTGFFASNGPSQVGMAMTGTGATFGGPFLPNEGYINSTAPNGLLLVSAGAIHLSSTGDISLSGGHVRSLSGGAPPTLSAGSFNCGTSATLMAGSTDVAGGVNVAGQVQSNGCQVVFGTPWPGTPSCFCSPVGSLPNTCTMIAGTTALNANFTSAGNVVSFRWFCIGN